MALTQLNFWSDGSSDADRLLRTIREMPHGARVTFLIHGYRFDPETREHDPHQHILSLQPRPGCWKAISWPRHLHVDRDPNHLGVAVGWPARGRLSRVAVKATRVGHRLSDALTQMHDLRPDLRIALFAHSLGARVALSAMASATTARIDKVILLSGAAYCEEAVAALESAAGRHARVLNIRTSENLPFDLAFRLSVPATMFASLPLSAGLRGHQRWTDLRIECPTTRNALTRMGYRLGTPRTRFCHWSGYLRPGVFAIYRAMLDGTAPDLLPTLATLGNGRRGRFANGENPCILSPL